MNKKFTGGLLIVLSLLIITSCNTGPIAEIQGVYQVDKEALKTSLKTKISGENNMAIGILNAAADNAVIEFCIKGDSINGIFYLAGETRLLKSTIIKRNDSLIISAPGFEAYLLPKTNGLLFWAKGSNLALKLNKTDSKELSSVTKNVIATQKAAIKGRMELEKILGKWQLGNYINKNGEPTGEQYAYCLVRGKVESSAVAKSDVYVKIAVEDKKMNFQVFNNMLNKQAVLPDSKSGTIQFTLPDGSTKTEEFSFNKNVAYETDAASAYNNVLQYNSLKVFIDLSTISEYFTDKYQFEIQHNNLTEVLSKLK